MANRPSPITPPSEEARIQVRGTGQLAKQMQAIMPHHRKRNNDAPARRDQPLHLFPEPEPPPKIDRRKLGGSKLKRGLRLSDEALRERGTLSFVQRA